MPPLQGYHIIIVARVLFSTWFFTQKERLVQFLDYNFYLVTVIKNCNDDKKKNSKGYKKDCYFNR